MTNALGTNGNSSITEQSIGQLYQELVSCLDDLVKIYRSLLEVVRKEKEILVESRLDELNENNKAKDALIVRIRSLENNRMKTARDLAHLIGSDVDQPRLLDIAANIGRVQPGSQERGDRLRNLHSVLELLVRRVADVNKANEELVQSALRTITGAMEAVKDGLNPKPTYERKGAMAQSRPEGGALVSREV